MRLFPKEALINTLRFNQQVPDKLTQNMISPFAFFVKYCIIFLDIINKYYLRLEPLYAEFAELF